MIEEVIQSATKVYPDNHIMKALCVCQAILESNLFNKPSRLATEGKNLFGIKGKGTDGSIYLWTKEWIKGKEISVQAAFAKNKTYEDSFIQHKNLLLRPRYAKVWEAQSAEEVFNAIKQAGYATDPKYPQKLMGVYARIKSSL